MKQNYSSPFNDTLSSNRANRSICTLLAFWISIFFCSIDVVTGQEDIGSKYPVEIFGPSNGGNLVLMVSGDGGGNYFNKNISSSLAGSSTSVVLLYSNKYFWDQKTPDQFSRDISEIVLHYMQKWNKKEFYIIGYSFGADVAAFLPQRLSADVRSKLRCTVLLSPSESTDFVIRIADMLRMTSKKRKYSITDEIKNMSGRLVCVMGIDDENTTRFKKIGVKISVLPGGHNFNNNFEALTAEIKKISGL